MPMRISLPLSPPLLINDLLEDLKQSVIPGIRISAECEEILALGYADDSIEGSDSVISLQKNCKL